MDPKPKLQKPKLTPELAFASLCVSMALFFFLLVLYFIPSLIDRYITAVETSSSQSQPRKGGQYGK